MKEPCDILIMGAKSNAIKTRIDCMEKCRGTNDRVFLLGDDSWPALKIAGWVLGKNTIETLQNFKKINSSNSRQTLVISGWYHLLRCWLILRSLGFKRIRLIPSTWKIWKTSFRAIINELKSLKGFYFD